MVTILRAKTGKVERKGESFGEFKARQKKKIRTRELKRRISALGLKGVGVEEVGGETQLITVSKPEQFVLREGKRTIASGTRADLVKKRAELTRQVTKKPIKKEDKDKRLFLTGEIETIPVGLLTKAKLETPKEPKKQVGPTLKTLGIEKVDIAEAERLLKGKGIKKGTETVESLAFKLSKGRKAEEKEFNAAVTKAGKRLEGLERFNKAQENFVEKIAGLQAEREGVSNAEKFIDDVLVKTSKQLIKFNPVSVTANLIGLGLAGSDLVKTKKGKKAIVKVIEKVGEKEIKFTKKLLIEGVSKEEVIKAQEKIETNFNKALKVVKKFDPKNPNHLATLITTAAILRLDKVLIKGSKSLVKKAGELVKSPVIKRVSKRVVLSPLAVTTGVAKGGAAKKSARIVRRAKKPVSKVGRRKGAVSLRKGKQVQAAKIEKEREALIQSVKEIKVVKVKAKRVFEKVKDAKTGKFVDKPTKFVDVTGRDLGTNQITTQRISNDAFKKAGGKVSNKVGKETTSTVTSNTRTGQKLISKVLKKEVRKPSKPQVLIQKTQPRFAQRGQKGFRDQKALQRLQVLKEKRQVEINKEASRVLAKQQKAKKITVKKAKIVKDKLKSPKVSVKEKQRIIKQVIPKAERKLLDRRLGALAFLDLNIQKEQSKPKFKLSALPKFAVTIKPDVKPDVITPLPLKALEKPKKAVKPKKPRKPSKTKPIQKVPVKALKPIIPIKPLQPLTKIKARFRAKIIKPKKPKKLPKIIISKAKSKKFKIQKLPVKKPQITFFTETLVKPKKKRKGRTVGLKFGDVELFTGAELRGF